MVKALFIIACGLFFTTPVLANLSPQLSQFGQFIDKTYRGEFSDSTPEKPIVDVNHWQRILNGQAVKLTHSLNQGEYGGETIFVWDKQRNSIVFYYFTTAGFYTTGSVYFEGNKLISTEKVAGNDDGITEVKSTMTLMPNGELFVESRYLKQGNWVDGHSVTYQEAPSAELVFK